MKSLARWALALIFGIGGRGCKTKGLEAGPIDEMQRAKRAGGTSYSITQAQGNPPRKGPAGGSIRST